MKIKVRNNHGRCMIRFKCPRSGQYVSKTKGDYYDPIDRHYMDGLALKLTNALKTRQWTGDIEDYVDSPSEQKRRSLMEMLKTKGGGNDKSIYMTVYRKLRGYRALESKRVTEAWLEENSGSPATYNRYRTVIQGVRPDLVEGIKPKKVSNGEPNPFSEDEQEQLLSNLLKDLEHALIPFWLKVGFRNGELAALTKDDFIAERGKHYISINKSYSKGVLKHIPKNGKIRRVPLSESDWLIFREPYLNRESAYRDINWDNWNRNVWKPLLKRSGLKYRKPYCLRHTAISNYIAKVNGTADAPAIFGTSIAMIEKHYLGAIKDVTPV